MKKIIICVYIFVVCFVSAHRAHAATTIDADIGSDTVWSATGSPYVLNSDTFISSGASLTILPGTHIDLAGHFLGIVGNLNARGGYFENGVINAVDPQPGPFLMRLFVPSAHAEGVRVSIQQSSFIDNSVTILNDSSDMIDARNNWWGTALGPQGQVSRNVDVQPWLSEKPKEACCSNVLFLPGIESSRLYTAGFLSENQLWEPNRNKDVEKLYMTASGTSKNLGIYTRDVIKETNFPAFNVSLYKSFSDSMDAKVASGTMQAWKSFAYDWRFGPDEIIASTSLVSDFESLARSSLTGKVTIVAHSNGGLLAKRLMQLLQGQGRTDLVDKIVFVAVPNFGTPKAVASLLYGEGQELGYGFLLSKDTAKNLAQNLPSAYNLLPSKIELTGQNNFLLSKAASLHASIDNWIPPSGVEVHTIVGTGLSTIDGIKYESNGDHTPIITTAGDGTVIKSSAVGSGGIIHEFDLAKLNGTEYNHNHADILEVPEIKTCVLMIMEHKLCNQNISDVQESISSISVHSPVDIHLIDSSGHHTGLVGSSSDEIRHVEQNIPNSSYLEFGEGKYIISSGDMASSTILLEGTGVGTFTLNIGTSTTFTNVPVTPLTKAQVVLGTTSPTLQIDINGDGIFDASTIPGTSTDRMLLIKSIQAIATNKLMSHQVISAILERLKAILDKKRSIR